MKKATNCPLNKFHLGMKPNHVPACESTMSRRLKLPAKMSTPISEQPRGIFWLTIWAEARKPPSIEYLLFDDHPASATPYTPTEVTPKMISSPMLTSAICNGVLMLPSLIQGPIGMTAMEVSAVVKATTGASRYKGLLT